MLELGSGTGLTALACGLNGAALTYMTDYHPVVIDNARQNIETNDLEEKVKVAKLDWRTCLEQDPEDEGLKTDFPIIIAADCIFDMEHSRLVPKVAKKYLSRQSRARFHVVITYRLKFKREVAAFEENMLKEGWIIEKTRLIERHAIDFRYSVYRLPDSF